MSSSFDDHNPPKPELLADCVHCGFCLPTCPTYQLWGEEMDSPRGRIHLMNLATEGQVPIDESFASHFDACLGCMACVSSCPSGVQYDQLIEAVRPQIERAVPRTVADRLFRALIFAIFPYPARLRVVALGAWLYQRSGIRSLLHRTGMMSMLPARMQALEALMPRVILRNIASRQREINRPVGAARRRVALISGCVQQVFFAQVNQATVRVLIAEGCEVVVPKQGCCGALSVHAGREEEGLDRARRMIESFEDLDVDNIVVNVAGCGSTLKEYGHLLADDTEYAGRAAEFSAKIRDITEVLASLEPQAPRHPIAARIAYHDACHLAHGQQIRRQPRDVLRTIPQLEVLEVPESELCCGSAGIYNMVQPEAGEELGNRKVANILSVQPDAVTTGNPGCLLQIARYLDGVPLFHPIELIDASIRGLNPLTSSEPRTQTPRAQKPMCDSQCDCGN
ncbi:heterodisulfide reductase-related iron-sulfur binding cluster [Rhodococcus ruber]|uniref:heterodisulfide reductase-related iron-sulfur binding cluster n=1 Tax=Rhodococcus ruber TaxID=1830 RepID=UPI001F27E565|nr:heterodisulfide reductase-related iron-sulfur binding cluster [Rhodococcus ruber]MCF8786222.1 4Fe-4S dicluster domain-containing protein [Rhodococcus ruber]